MTSEVIVEGAARYYRHSDAFWRDLIARQPQSGQGVRKFCQSNGVAPGTFHKRRAMLLAEGTPLVQPVPVTTADATFLPIASDPAIETNSLSVAHRPLPAKGNVRDDSVIVTSGGMRVEMTGAHADRIVRHLLNRMNGFTC